MVISESRIRLLELHSEQAPVKELQYSAPVLCLLLHQGPQQQLNTILIPLLSSFQNMKRETTYLTPLIEAALKFHSWIPFCSTQKKINKFKKCFL